MVLADGLVPVAPFDQYQWSVPALRDTCAGWLAGGSRNTDFSIDIPLEVAGAAKNIAESCHIAEFRLQLNRSATLVPKPTGWSFVAAREKSQDGKFYDADGLLVDQVTPIPVDFANYCNSLAGGIAVIPPIESQQKEAAGFATDLRPTWKTTLPPAVSRANGCSLRGMRWRLETPSWLFFSR